MLTDLAKKSLPVVHPSLATAGFTIELYRCNNCCDLDSKKNAVTTASYLILKALVYNHYYGSLTGKGQGVVEVQLQEF